MNLPENITKAEMQQLLHQLRTEYFPNEDGSFLDQLDEEGLKFTFDIIGEKEETKREQMWNTLEQTITNNEKQKVLLTQGCIQKANQLILNYRESLKQQQDNADLEVLESNF